MNLRSSRALTIAFVLPIFLHAHLLLGGLVSAPLFSYAGLNTAVHGILDGNPTIDPNIGFVDQALTARAMDFVFSGALPWWNPYEGFGGPLAGEMQCSALFPLSILIALPGGTLVMNIVLQILAGIGLLLLLLRLRIAPFAALAAAVTFETCGTFVWMAGGGSYSIPFLPWLVLGIEILRESSPRARMRGSLTVAVSLAMLIYAGDIETAYLEGLGAVVWVLVRLSGRSDVHRSTYARRLIVATIAGLALASPIVVAFGDMLAISNVGMHDGSANAILPELGFVQKFMPYVYGPIFSTKQSDVADVWGSTGGYIGFMPAVLALVGVFGRRERSLRFACAVLVIFGFSAIFGGPLLSLVTHVPGVRYTAYYRYVDPLVSFAVAVLAAFALDDLSRAGSPTIKRLSLAAIAVLVLIGFAASRAWPQVSGGPNGIDAGLTSWRIFSVALIVVGCGAIVASLRIRAHARSLTILGLALMLETIALLIVPSLSEFSNASIDLGGVDYLQQHLGLQRYYTLGPLGANYGSYFGIASLNYADIPFPAKSVAYIKSQLDAEADPVVFVPGAPRSHGSVTANFVAKVDAFAKAGVKYVLSDRPLPRSSSLHLRFHNATMYVTEIDGTTAYASAPSCTIEASSRTFFVTHCRRASTLCRLELNAPGWEATVGAIVQTPRTCGKIFQSVAVPAGSTTVAFSFEPPYVRPALLAASIGGVWLAFTLWGAVRTYRVQ